MPNVTIEIVVEAESEAEARVKIMRRLREMGRKRRCSQCDSDCLTMTHAEVVDCFMGWGYLPAADGYCPFIHTTS